MSVTLPQIKWVVQNAQLNVGNLNNVNGAIYVTKDGTIYIGSNGTTSFPTGTTNHLGTIVTSSTNDVYMQKWDANGNRIWSRTGILMNGGGTDVVWDIGGDENGNVYSIQYGQGVPTGVTAGGGRDYWAGKFVNGATATTFSREWAVSAPIATSADEFSGQGRGAFDPVTKSTYVVLQSSGTSTWAGGGIAPQGGGWVDLIIGKISSAGVVQWVVQNQTINTTAHDFTGPCWVGADGHLVIGHGGNGAWTGGVGASWMMKINGNDGSLIWKNQTVLASATAGNITAVRTDLDNNIYVCLVTTSAMTGTTAVGGQDVVIVKLNSAGTRLWSIRPTSINTTSNEPSATIDVDTSGNVYLAYTSVGTVAGQTKIGSDDLTIAKITTAGVVEWVWTPTQLNLATQEQLSRIGLDKYRNIYLYFSTIGALPNQTPPSTTFRTNVLAKLGPAEQISYDPADQIPPTPLLTNVTVSAPAVTEDTIPNGFSVNSVITSLGANLVSPGQNTGIAIYAADTTNGQWHYSINNGGLWTVFPAVSESSYLLLNGTNTIIRYTPAANSTASSSISYRAWSGQASWNGNTYAAGSTYSITYGADTPFSEGTATTTLAVTPVNDAPTMNTATYVLPNLSTQNSDVGVDLLTIMNNFTIADVDQSVADITQLGIAIITADTTLGDWEYSEDSGTTWLPLGAVSITSAVHFNIAATTLIRFVPITTTSVGATTITFVGWDKSNAASLVNKRANATIRGGANPYSSSVGTLTRTIIAPPTVPRSVKASIGDGSITFNWTAPLFHGFSGAMTYNIYDAADNLVTSVTDTTATITTDTTAASFTYKISAYNGILEGPTSSSISYLGPASLATIERSHMEFDLSWSVPYTQGPTSIITYDIINVDTNILMQSNITDTFTSLNGMLVAGQTYNLKVRAKMNGIIADSNTQTAIAPFIATPTPDTPQLGNTQLTIAWNNTSSLVQGATFLGYKIYYRKDGATEYVTSLISETTTTVTGLQGVFDSLTINATSATFTGLTNGDLYKFRVVTVADIDGTITNGPSSAIIRGIPVAPTIVVSNLSASITSAVLDNDTTLAISAIEALKTSDEGKSKVVQSFSELATGTTQQAAAAGSVFVGLPTASAKTILKSIIETETVTVKQNLLGQAVQTNAPQVGSVITALDTLDERKTAVVAAVQAAIQATSASVLSAALNSGIVTSTEVRQAVGASDIATRISVSTIKSNITSVVSNFSASVAEVKASSDTAKIQIISGAVDQIMRTGAEVINNSSATVEEKTAVKVNAATALLKEANAVDIDTATKNTFVAALKTNYPGETIELPTEAKTTLLASIPAGRIDATLVDTSKALSIIVPNGTEILLSKILPNQFVAMEVGTQYTFKNKDSLSDTAVVATYKQSEAGPRYLEKADGTQIQLGGKVIMFGHPFFLAAAADPLIVPATAPPAPTNVVATRTGGTINVAFTQASDGGDTITAYEYSINGGVSFTTTGLTWVSGQSTLSIANLTRGQTYSITLRAINGVGPGAQSEASNLILIPTIPNPPTNVVATREDSQATVTFIAPINNGGATITSYTITVIENGVVTARTINTTNVTYPISVLVDSLTNGTPYSFKVIATNEVGDSAFSQTSAAVIPTTAPTTPTDLIATANNDSVRIEFIQTNINNITGYEYSTDGGATFISTNLSWVSGQSSVRISKLNRGATYTFILRSVNWVGTSGSSMPISAIISSIISSPVEVNFNVTIESDSSLNVFGYPVESVTNIIIPERNLPVDALYDEANNKGLIELWEPSADPTNIYVKLASSVKDGLDLTDSFKITAKKMVLGLQKILCDKFDCKLAVPFDHPNYANTIDYTTQRDFGRIALAVFAHYLFGHVDATAAITNDVEFVKNMLSISSDDAAIKETDGALDRYNSYTKTNYINTTDVINWPETGTQADANLAICLVRNIIAKGLDVNSELAVSNVNTATSASLAYIVKQVIGQDATRLMGVDNSQRAKDQVQLLRFYAGDIIYLNIKIAKPSVTVGSGQSISSTTFRDSYQTEQSFTLKITLE